MTRFPGITGKELIAVLGKLGFELIRVRGAHHYLRHGDGRTVVVPVHAGDDVGRGLLGKLLRIARIDAEDLRRLL